MEFLDLCEHRVLEVLVAPHFHKGFWRVKVKVDCNGGISTPELSFKDKEAAEKYTIGYEFLA